MSFRTLCTISEIGKGVKTSQRTITFFHSLLAVIYGLLISSYLKEFFLQFQLSVKGPWKSNASMEMQPACPSVKESNTCSSQNKHYLTKIPYNWLPLLFDDCHYHLTCSAIISSLSCR